MPEPFGPRLPALGINPPHAQKTLPDKEMIPDRLLPNLFDEILMHKRAYLDDRTILTIKYRVFIYKILSIPISNIDSRLK
jgi:hypothetical protein